MTKKPWLELVGILLAILFVFMYAIAAQDSENASPDSDASRADVLYIDSMKSFGDLERPPVLFLHDQHTDALEKVNKDCQACHLSENKSMSLRFKRTEDANRQQVMDVYHGECLACHREMSAAGSKAGPLEACGACHGDWTNVTDVMRPIAFDHSLHFRHAEATKDKKTNEDNCGACHHEYDQRTQAIYYAKGKEGSCRYCHKAELEENRISMRSASHVACISCHREIRAENAEKLQTREVGPVTCAGCHDSKKQQTIRRVKDIPRMERDQPDVVLMRVQQGNGDQPQTTVRMAPVPFDHKSHEGYTESCRVCHHASLESCSTKCHTVTGSREGDGVTLEQAMHLRDKQMSCTGCHESKQHEKQCAGCHASMAADPNTEKRTCAKCHMLPPQAFTGIEQPPEVTARMLLESRSPVEDTYEDESVPEDVVIGDLFYQYESVKLPHRKIVHTLVEHLKDEKLAAYFHNEEGTLCQGCHHNSPVAKKPPPCVSCHGQPFDEKNLLRPGLKAAYHQQCLGCHKEMGMEKPRSTECADCHKVVGANRLYDF
jgi:predicted CXXCH cytochrome family protein